MFLWFCFFAYGNRLSIPLPDKEIHSTRNPDLTDRPYGSYKKYVFYMGKFTNFAYRKPLSVDLQPFSTVLTMKTSKINGTCVTDCHYRPQYSPDGGV